jgi:hypothetical protein
MSGMHLCGIGVPSSHGPSQSPAPRFHLERVAPVDVSRIVITCHLMGEVGASHISAPVALPKEPPSTPPESEPREVEMGQARQAVYHHYGSAPRVTISFRTDRNSRP